jgi:hypothetical protein
LAKGRKKEGKNKTGRRQEEDRKFKEVMVNSYSFKKN